MNCFVCQVDCPKFIEKLIDGHLIKISNGYNFFEKRMCNTCYHKMVASFLKEQNLLWPKPTYNKKHFGHKKWKKR